MSIPDNDPPQFIDDVMAAVRENRDLRPGHHYSVRLALNGVSFSALLLADPVVLGRQVLKAAHLHPADDFALFLITEEGDFEDIRPDEEVDLRGRRAHTFIAFSGDPLYRLKLEERNIVWGLPIIDEAVLRTLSDIGPDEAVFLQVRGGADVLIEEGAQVDLTRPGIEVFATAPRKKLYHFFVDGKRYETEHESLTGGQIKAMVPNWDQTHDLALEGHGDEPDRLIGDDEVINLDPKHGIRRFSSVPKANFG